MQFATVGTLWLIKTSEAKYHTNNYRTKTKSIWGSKSLWTAESSVTQWKWWSSLKYMRMTWELVTIQASGLNTKVILSLWVWARSQLHTAGDSDMSHAAGSYLQNISCEEGWVEPGDYNFRNASSVPAWGPGALPNIISFDPLNQWSPAFLAPGTDFMEGSFSTAWSQWMVSGWFKHITFIVHFISVVITARGPQPPGSNVWWLEVELL